MSARVLALGIDAGSPVLLRRWAGDGTMPHLAELIARGAHGTMRGIDGFHIGSTWPSFYTGCTPAAHGVHYLLQLRPGSYELDNPLLRENGVRRPPFWRALSLAGKDVAILDVPLSRLDPDIRGIQTVEWGGHDSVFGFRATPPGLAQRVETIAGRYPLGPSCDGIRTSSGDFEAFTGLLTRAVRAKTALTLQLLRERNWDLLLQVFTEAHCAGHQCWHLHDASHPAHDPLLRPSGEDPLRQVYRAIDDAIGTLMREASDATVIVFSAHGMAHWYGGQFLLREVLFRLGLATRPPAPAGAGLRTRLVDGLGRVYRALPAAIRTRLSPVRASVLGESRKRPPSLGVDTRSSRCFVVPNGQPVAGIRVNLRGREPSGVVAPGREAEDLFALASERLLAIVDERTGRPAFRRVARTADLYRGESSNCLPDLLVEWSEDPPTGCRQMAGGKASRVALTSPEIGRIEGENTYARSGEHRPDGFLAAAGPGILPGALPDVSLLDLAPTLCGLVGVELDAVEGRAIPGLCRS
ncbi:MAG: alkaline phosphatase family protein [Gemmatimonadales bacterium]